MPSCRTQSVVSSPPWAWHQHYDLRIRSTGRCRQAPCCKAAPSTVWDDFPCHLISHYILPSTMEFAIHDPTEQAPLLLCHNCRRRNRVMQRLPGEPKSRATRRPVKHAPTPHQQKQRGRQSARGSSSTRIISRQKSLPLRAPIRQRTLPQMSHTNNSIREQLSF